MSLEGSKREKKREGGGEETGFCFFVPMAIVGEDEAEKVGENE